MGGREGEDEIGVRGEGRERGRGGCTRDDEVPGSCGAKSLRVAEQAVGR